jgi:RQC domain
MSRRRQQRATVRLDARGIDSLPLADIKAIMRGAEDLIAQGGRTLLCKILKGSRDKDVLSRALDANPSWGVYRDLPGDEVMARIDWTILNRYLCVEYNDRLPLLCYGDAGLDIEIETIADEYLARIALMKRMGVDTAFFESLKDTPRATLWRLLDKIEATRDPALVPLLRAWAEVAHRKVRVRITSMAAVLERSR